MEDDGIGRIPVEVAAAALLVNVHRTGGTRVVGTPGEVGSEANHEAEALGVLAQDVVHLLLYECSHSGGFKTIFS